MVFWIINGDVFSNNVYIMKKILIILIINLFKNKVNKVKL